MTVAIPPRIPDFQPSDVVDLAAGQRVEEGDLAGQAAYTDFMLRYVYDVLVLGFSNHFVWGCPTPLLLEHYDRHVTGRHLEVGVGTGYLLDHCRFPVPSPEIAIADLNVSTLLATARRIARYHPTMYRLNVLEPIPLDRRFASIGFNYVLHCLPDGGLPDGGLPDGGLPDGGLLDGGLTDSGAAGGGSSGGGKLRALRHLSALLEDGGRLFGSTIVAGAPMERRPAASWLAGVYNRKRIFSNARDTVEGLRAGLEGYLGEVEVTVHGCVAVFSGRKGG